MVQVRGPGWTPSDTYYQCRYAVLREPLGFDRGAELLADDADAIACAVTEGAGFRLRLRSVASLMASSLETLSHVEEAASEWHGPGDCCHSMGSGTNAHEVVDILLGAAL